MITPTRTQRHHAWLAVAALLTVGGIAGTVLAAGSVVHNEADKARISFEHNSDQVASTLELAIQREDDLVVNAGAFLLGNPDVTNTEFRAWASTVKARERYPEMQGFGYAVLVSAAELPAYAARAKADPNGALGPDGEFAVEPPGERPSLCLSPIGKDWNPEFQAPAGLDYCATEFGPALLEARDSGRGAYIPYELGERTWLAVQTPIYAGGGVPATVEARQAAFLAWVGTAIEPKILLDRALQGHPDTAVTLRHASDDLPAVFSSGKAPEGAQSATIDLHNGWTVQTFGVGAAGGLFANGAALALLFAGVGLSILLGVLVFVLGTTRARALRLVQERTEELRGAQAQLVETARRAGMAEIATDVLHNVGNVLNSVNVSANLVVQKVRGSKSAGLAKAVALMRDHSDDLGDFLTIDSRGKSLPGYLEQLAAALTVERASIEEELLRLTKGVAHIEKIVSAQQSLAGVSGVIDPVNLGELMEDALRMAGALGDDDLTVVRDFPDDPPLLLDRHRVLLVLLNLIGNAMHAMKRNDGPHELGLRAEVTPGEGVRFTVTDNGVGIPTENLTRIFVHGFTTHADGHGFGLHSSALAAQEMGGALTVQSEGAGTGAVFTLDVPLENQAVMA